MTGYPHNDTNNLWQILPEKPFPDDKRHGHRVRNNNVVRLRHIVTNTILLSHDVASPYYPTNQEFTTTSMENANGPKANNTLFEIKIEHGKKDQVFSTVSSHMKLIHRPSRVAMWTHTTPLPDWGYKQQEINGNKNVAQSSNIWFVEDIHSIAPDDERLHKEPRKVKSLPFLRKYIELQRAMFFHNNALTSSHPYSSQPFQWPVLLRGVSFWTKNDTKQQIYFVGNPIGWWFVASILAVFLGIVGADQLTLRRGLDVLDHRRWIYFRTRNPYIGSSPALFPLPPPPPQHPSPLMQSFSSLASGTSILIPAWATGTRSRLYNSTGFFFLCWAAHYLPFYLMGRQLFLHHYLPAHLASCLVAGAVVEFVFNVDPIVLDDSPSADDAVVDGKDKKRSELSGIKRPMSIRERLGRQSMFATWIATGVIMTAVIGGWYFFAPLTYGNPGLTVEQVKARKWMGYDLHFAK